MKSFIMNASENQLLELLENWLIENPYDNSNTVQVAESIFTTYYMIYPHSVDYHNKVLSDLYENAAIDCVTDFNTFYSDMFHEINNAGL